MDKPTTIVEYLSQNTQGQIHQRHHEELDSGAQSTITQLLEKDGFAVIRWIYLMHYALIHYKNINRDKFHFTPEQQRQIQVRFKIARKKVFSSYHKKLKAETLELFRRPRTSFNRDPANDNLTASIGEPPYRISELGKLGNDSVFHVLIFDPDFGDWQVVGCIFLSPLGWSADSDVCNLLEKNKDLELIEGAYSLPTMSQEKHRYLVSNGLLLAYKLLIACFNKRKKTDRLPDFEKLIQNWNCSRQVTPHDRCAHTAFRWIKEHGNAHNPHESIHGRRISSHSGCSLIKVRRPIKAASINSQRISP